MKRVKITLMALLAVFCVSAVTAAAASANEGEFVNAKGEAVKGTASLKGGETKTESSSGNIICKTSTGFFNATNKTEGTLHLLDLGCGQSLLGKCQTSGDPEGHMTWLLDWRTRRDSQPSGAVLLLIAVLNASKELATEAKPFEYKCGASTVKVFGSYLTRIKPLNKLSNTFTFESTNGGSFENSGEYESEAEKGVKHKEKLRANFGLGWENVAQVGTEEMTLEGKEEGEFK
jgi:hypothetical protein